MPIGSRSARPGAWSVSTGAALAGTRRCSIPGTTCRCRRASLAPGAWRNGAPFKDWLLPGALERVRRRLAGVGDGDRQMVDILTAVLSDGLTAVEAACAEALREGVYSADVVLNILGPASASHRRR
jgi:hypothetical protein